MKKGYIGISEFYWMQVIIAEVRENMCWNEDKAQLWYLTENPHFGNVSPAAMVRLGRAHKVIQFIESVKEGN